MESEEIVAQLETFMAETVELRRDIKLPKRTDAAAQIQERLEQARQAQDRVEEIMRTINPMKHLAYRQKADAESVASNEWATNLSKIRQLPSFRGDYVGPREKYAEADLSTMGQRRKYLEADKLLSHVNEAHDFVRTCYFGLNGVRDDIKDLLRTLPNELRM